MTRLRWIGYGTALLVGVGLSMIAGISAHRSGRNTDTSQPAGAPASRGTSFVERRAGRGLDGAGRVERMAARDYQEAWDAIAFRNVTIQQRVALQKDVLRQWSLVDLEGALRAALDGDWWGRLDEDGAVELADCFREAFRRSPQEAWELLETEPGMMLAKNVFKTVWGAVLRADPEAFKALAGRLPQESAEQYMRYLITSEDLEDPEKRRAFMEEVAAAVPEAGRLDLMLAGAARVTSQETREALLERLASAASPAHRAAALADYLSAMAEAGNTSVRLELESTAMLEDWRKLPAETRAGAIDALFHSIISNRRPLDLVEIAVAEGRLDLLEDDGVGNSINYDYGGTFGDPAIDFIAAWAMKLPEAPEAEGLFRSIIAGPIFKNSETARSWMETLPPGWHRNHALSILIHANPESPRTQAWAREMITDPVMRKRVDAMIEER